MSEHTKGPWIAQDPLDMEGMRHIYVKDASKHILCRVDGHFGGVSCGALGHPDEHQTTANARLIAAAPDLLVAMVKAAANIRINTCADCGGVDYGCTSCGTATVLEQIDAAIAKAKGEPND